MSSDEMKPKRIQLRRTKGWRMPPNTVKVTRPGKWGNPFKIGGWFEVGDPLRTGGYFQSTGVHFQMSWCQADSKEIADRTPGRFTLIESNEQAVAFFRQLLANGYRKDYSELRGKNLGCWCKIGTACHADVLLELANSP